MTYSLSGTTPSFTTIPLQDTANSTYGNPQIQSIRMSKESQLEIIPFPLRDSSYAIVWDLMGVLRNITIQGNNQGTVTQLKKFILDLEARINGVQYNNTTPKHTIVLTLGMSGASSDVDVSYNVVVKTFSWNFNAGTPLQIEWILECLEGTVAT